jgi:hypothetical protein
MNAAKRYLLVALAVVFAVTTFSVIAPRTAHALVATLVQVANTSANPVPVASATHFGQQETNLVTLVGAISSGIGVSRLFPDDHFEQA